MELWNWKYAKNPHGFPIIWVAEDMGRIVGCYILNPVKLRIGQVLVMGAQSVDAAVDNAYRGGGIFKKLAVGAIAQAAKDGVSIIYAFPNEISFKGQVRIGYHHIFFLPKMYRFFRINSLLEGRFGLNGSFLRKTEFFLDSFQRINKKKTSVELNRGLNVKVIADFDSRFEFFWKEICKYNHSILIERDLAYLNWRYMKHPEKHYATFVCEKNGEIVGYVVTNIENNISIEKEATNRISVGNIVDLLTLPNMTDAAHSLIFASCDYFRREKADIARCWMFKWHPFYKLLRKLGFSDSYELLRRAVSRSKYSSRVICYVISVDKIQAVIESIESKIEPCWWFMMQGDSDFA
jgi:hypothetical protein